MDRPVSYRSWWQPLPVWLKLVAICGAFPAWFIIAYCVLTGQAKSWAALIAFAVFAICTVLHIAFDQRNRRGGIIRHRGFDVGGGE